MFRESEPGVCHSLDSPLGEVVAYSLKAPYKTAGMPNEDCIAVIEVDKQNVLLVVADGVGGSPGGAFASGVVIDVLAEAFIASPDPGAIPALVISALEQAHQDIRARGGGSASTVALAHLQPNTFRPAHAGDSVVLVCGQRGKLKFETIAHSPVGYALEAGVLSEDEAFAHEDRHVVSNIIGGQDMHMTLGGTVQLAPRDTLLLASDGVTDNLYTSEIVETIRKGKLLECGERLAALVAERMPEGKPDDISFLLFRPGGRA